MQPTKTRSLYQGTIQIEFYEKPYHYFTINGVRAPFSTTGITGLLDKPALKFWAANLGRDFLLEKFDNGERITRELIIEAAKQHTIRTRDEATSGKEVHKWAEAYILNQIEKKPKPEMPKDERVLNGVIAFLRWVDEHEIKFLASELPVYSKKYKFPGLMDCKFTMKDEKHKIIHGGDFKTGSWEIVKNTKGEITAEKPYNEHLYQVAGYTSADIEESGDKYGTDWIIYFGKDTGEFKTFELNKPKAREKNYKAFLGLLLAKKREVELKNN
jgi:hypothetical protein